jgi:serine/threonine protein kinase
LHDVLSDVEISAVLQQGGDEGVMCQSLVNQALQAGSTDNISCQLVRIDQLPAEHADDFYRKLTELPFPPPLKAGLSVDGYRVLREIHASARSQLYVVEDETDGKRYCMKTPSANFDDDPAYIERFIMEGWIGRRVHNAHVAKVIEPSRPRTFLYYLTEYVNGPTLEQWMRENPRASLDQVIYITDQIAQGLRALHRREILHQDIKPANIMLTRDGEAKIVDFGSCHVAGAAEIVTPFQRDVALGTVTYSAPEYTLRLPGTPASDVFSLAVMAYQMLTGQLPFDGKLEQCRHREQYLALRYTPSYEINPLVPVWMDGPIRRCLRLDPAARYQEVSEFIYDMTHPNPKYHRPFQRAHIDKDPLMFWKRCVVILLLVQCALVVALLHDT